MMEWRRVSDNRPVSEGVVHRIIDNKRVVYNLTITGNSTVENGDSYFCNTTRSAKSNAGCKSGEIKLKGTGRPCAALLLLSVGTNLWRHIDPLGPIDMSCVVQCRAYVHVDLTK